MKKVAVGYNFAVFLLFFGVATLDALHSGDWSRAGFWLLIGTAFLAADNFRP